MESVRRVARIHRGPVTGHAQVRYLILHVPGLFRMGRVKELDALF